MMDELLAWAARLQTVDVLPLLIKITLIAAIGRLVIAAMPKAAAAFRCAIAVATLAAMLLVPAITAARIEWRIPILHSASDRATVESADDALPNALDLSHGSFRRPPHAASVWPRGCGRRGGGG